MSFKIKIEKEALTDIQKSIKWYNEQQAGLGRRFHTQVKESLTTLEVNPFFQIRYDNVHCLPLDNFPYMIHFTIDKKNRIVIVRGVFHTSKSLNTWRKRNE